MSQPSDGPKPRPRVLLDVRTMLALVACTALVLWSWRTLRDNDPVRAAARRVDSGREDDRLQAVFTLSGAQANEAEVAIPALLGSLEDEAQPVRLAALQGLIHLAELITHAPPRGAAPPDAAEIGPSVKTVTGVLL